MRTRQAGFGDLSVPQTGWLTGRLERDLKLIDQTP
jgi:hypothetical protein